MSDFNVPGSRPKKHDEISEIDRTQIAAGPPGVSANPAGKRAAKRARRWCAIPSSYQEGTGSVRFVSVLDFSKIHQFGSVRFSSVRCGSMAQTSSTQASAQPQTFPRVRIRLRAQSPWKPAVASQPLK